MFSEFNNAGCLLISEVKYLLENRDKEAPDTACAAIILLSRNLYFLLRVPVCTTRRLNTSRPSPSSIRQTPPAQFESAPLFLLNGAFQLNNWLCLEL